MVRAVIWCAVSSHAQHQPDKISLPQQESDALAAAGLHGWDVVDLMKVPGHSRRYIDFHVLANHAAKEGVDAFYKLQSHWENRDFDVLIVRDGDRFARTQALHAYITERTIAIGARIYSLHDGWIDETNYRLWIAMSGYKSAGDIDRLIKQRDVAMTGRAQRGLPVSSRIPMSHKLIRDQVTGKALRLEVNEDLRRLWDDLAVLILEGIAWDKIEFELFNRYGHVDKNGDSYYPNYMYKLIMKPFFWGHIARYHHSPRSKNGYRLGSWIYEIGEPIPEGALIFRNTHPAVWTGPTADLVKAELLRRTDAVRGNANPQFTHRFSGLGVCAECGSFLSTFVKKGYRGLICPAAKSKSLKLPECGNGKVINEKKVIALMNAYLYQMIQHDTTNVFDSLTEDRKKLDNRIEVLATEIEKEESHAKMLIRDRLSVGDEIRHLYDEELAQINTRLKSMRATGTMLDTQRLSLQRETTSQHTTLGELAELTLEAFWQQESRVINQMLHRLMGKNRLLLLNGQIIGVAEINRRQRSHT